MDKKKIFNWVTVSEEAKQAESLLDVLKDEHTEELDPGLVRSKVFWGIRWEYSMQIELFQ